MRVSLIEEEAKPSATAWRAAGWAKASQAHPAEFLEEMSDIRADQSFEPFFSAARPRVAAS